MRTNLFALGGIERLVLLFRSSLVAAVMLCAASNPAAAATITNTWSYDPPLNGWIDQNFTIPKFAPVNGTLVRLDIRFSMSANSTIRLTSGCTDSKFVNSGYTNAFTLSSSNLNVTGRVGGRVGSTVNSGQTVTRANLLAIQSSTNEIFEPKLGLFVGIGAVPLTMRRSQIISSSCSDNVCNCISPAFVSVDAKIEVEFIYVYEPPPALAVVRVPAEQTTLLEWNQTPGFIYVVEKSVDFNDWWPFLTNINFPPVAREAIPFTGESRQFFRLKRTRTGSP